MDILADAGCYASSSKAVMANAISQACGPYAIAAVRVTGVPCSPTIRTGAFRGFGVNQVTFAMEQQVKQAATPGMAPDAIRRRNFVREGDVWPRARRCLPAQDSI
ncbi:MAG: molybdopterin-dependent oxidoreductase [Acidobacteria bacterium]|nr:molybdopterin-dependent oxidoreductase [Acidobacteriota bacterium]